MNNGKKNKNYKKLFNNGHKKVEMLVIFAFYKYVHYSTN